MKYWMYVIVCIAVIFMLIVFTNADYINRPFGECELNHSVDYGSFKSCGDLMSDTTAKVGLFSIFLGLPLISFVILPILVKRKKEKKQGVKNGN